MGIFAFYYFFSTSPLADGISNEMSSLRAGRKGYDTDVSCVLEHSMDIYLCIITSCDFLVKRHPLHKETYL